MSTIEVHGEVDNGFEAVREEFVSIVTAEGGDLDVQVAAYHQGQLVVDLWAGPDCEQDSLLALFSVSKGLTHLVVALLIQEGVLDLDAPVSKYWPEFGTRGKERLLLRELLSHQAGVVGTPEGFTIDELVDESVVAARLADQEPFWRPGSMSGYHGLVMGALSGEVVRRATGATVQQLFAERFRDPLGLDAHLGIGPADDDRYLTAQPMTMTPERFRAAAAEEPAPDSLFGIAFNNQAPENPDLWDLPNFAQVRRAGTTSFGGVATARSLAKLYAAMASGVDDVGPLLSTETIASISQIQTNGVDAVLGNVRAWAVGFHSYGAVHPCLSANSFGHSGAGGQQSLVDPRNELSYAYLRRRFVWPDQAVSDHNRLLQTLRSVVA